MSTLHTDLGDDVTIDEMSRDELLALIDREARENFNMSGEDFAAKWASGGFQGVDDPRLSDLAILLP